MPWREFMKLHHDMISFHKFPPLHFQKSLYFYAEHRIAQFSDNNIMRNKLACTYQIYTVRLLNNNLNFQFIIFGNF